MMVGAILLTLAGVGLSGRQMAIWYIIAQVSFRSFSLSGRTFYAVDDWRFQLIPLLRGIVSVCSRHCAACWNLSIAVWLHVAQLLRRSMHLYPDACLLTAEMMTSFPVFGLNDTLTCSLCLDMVWEENTPWLLDLLLSVLKLEARRLLPSVDARYFFYWLCSELFFNRPNGLE